MRKVFTGREIPHVFASKSQFESRNGNCSLWHEGDTLFSYREPIAMFYGDSVLISDDNFSFTTSKHMSWTQFALRQYAQVRVPALRALRDVIRNECELAGLEYIEKRIRAIEPLTERLSKARAPHRKAAIQSEISAQETGAAIAWRAIGKKGDW